MARLFGTDGVRGRANREVTAELALGLAAAAAHVLALSGAFAGHRPRPMARKGTRGRQHVRRSRREVKGELRGHVTVCAASNAVGPEESSHRCPP